MSAHEIALHLDQFSLTSRATARERALHIILLPGELLRVPRKFRSLRVIKGAAWVSSAGLDHALYAGGSLRLDPSRSEALVSAERQTLVLEVA